MCVFHLVRVVFTQRLIDIFLKDRKHWRTTVINVFRSNNNTCSIVYGYYTQFFINSRGSSRGRALDWSSKGFRFESGSWHFVKRKKRSRFIKIVRWDRTRIIQLTTERPNQLRHGSTRMIVEMKSATVVSFGKQKSYFLTVSYFAAR